MSSIFPPEESRLPPPVAVPETDVEDLKQLREVEAGTLLDESLFDLDGEASDNDQRRTYRHPVEVSRPIGLQLLSDSLEPVTGWLLADILDVSLGGVCLLITDSADHPFAPHRRVRLNVTAHPTFGVSELLGELRWFVKSEYVVTMGIRFEQSLDSLPDLLPCRRSLRRPLEG